MRLNDLMENAAMKAGGTETEIKGITCDSRAVRPGFLFAALPGSKIDGRAYIDDAIAHGAAAILTTPDLQSALPVPVITDRNPRRRLAHLAAKFYGRQPGTIVAVTGTSGKTSVADFTRQIWQALGHQAASLGTLGIVTDSGTQKGALTSPDPVTLHRDLKDLADRGVTHAALEASSHGLDQFRLDGVVLQAAAFTNLSHDHLDYHASMAAYLTAKQRLFRDVLPAHGTAVLNQDVSEYAELAAITRQRGGQVLSYGRTGEDLQLLTCDTTPAGQKITLQIQGQKIAITTTLFGEFQAHNLLCALGLVIATGGDALQAAKAAAQIKAVPGRLQLVARHPSGAAILVDYAHKPHALETALQAVRPSVLGKLRVVFGCGGDRDSLKRPLMGEIAARLADQVIVTDDNPRSEDAANIRAAILEKCPGAVEIGDRAEAIGQAIAQLQAGDILIIAGKGHETGQIVGDRTLPFSDTEIARKVTLSLGGEAL